MFEKPCRLARAAKYFKSGGGSSIDVPTFKQTLGDAIQGFGPISRIYRNFADKEDFLKQQVPLLDNLAQMGTQEAARYAAVPGQLMQGANQLRTQFGQLPGQMLNILKGQLPIAQTGALTQDQRNEAVQQARAGAQARGDIYSNPAIFAEAMNRRKYADARQQQAIGNVLQLGQGALQTATGREAAAMGLDQGAMGISQGREQLVGYPSEQLTKGELGRVGAFQTIFGPEENLAGDELKAKAAAETAGAGNSQSQSNSNKQAIIGIIGAAATAY